MNDINRSYKILGLEPGASPEEVKQAYRDLVRVWHPDRYSYDSRLQEKVQEKLKEINEAYEKINKYYCSYKSKSQKKEKKEYKSEKKPDEDQPQPQPKTQQHKPVERGSPPLKTIWPYLMIGIIILIYIYSYIYSRNPSEVSPPNLNIHEMHSILDRIKVLNIPPSMSTRYEQAQTFTPDDLREMALKVADHYGIPKDMFLGYLAHESGWQATAKNPEGDTGVGLITPGFWKEFGNGQPLTNDQNDPRLHPGWNMDAIARGMVKFKKEAEAQGYDNPWPAVIRRIGPARNYAPTEKGNAFLKIVKESAEKEADEYEQRFKEKEADEKEADEYERSK